MKYGIEISLAAAQVVEDVLTTTLNRRIGTSAYTRGMYNRIAAFSGLHYTGKEPVSREHLDKEITDAFANLCHTK